MGGRHTTQVIRDNPQTIAALTNMSNQFNNLNKEFYQMRLKHEQDLNKLSQQYEKQVQELKFLKDPDQVEKAEQQIFNNFVSQLKTFDKYNTIPKDGGMRYVAIVGENSAGKSAMLNHVLDLDLEEGVDDTTQYIQKVHQDATRKLVYFDSPGLNQTFSITHAEYLKAFYTIDCMFIATSVTFKNSIRTIQVMDKINPPKLYLVRNQCDKFATEAQFQKAVQKDKKVIKQQCKAINVKKVLYVSAKMGDNYRDNAEFKRLLKGE